MKPNCQRICDLLAQYADGTLSDAERAEVQRMRELDFARMLDRQEEYLALPEFLARLEHHQVVAYLVRSVNLREVSASLPSRVIEGLAI